MNKTVEVLEHNNFIFTNYDYLFSALHHMKYLATYLNVLQILQYQDWKYLQLKNHFLRSKVNTVFFLIDLDTFKTKTMNFIHKFILLMFISHYFT